MRQCPPEFQDAFTRQGGTNQYGDPIFKLVWGPAEVQRSGGYWARDGYLGYRDFLNITRLARVIPACEPTEEDLWGSYFATYGR